MYAWWDHHSGEGGKRGRVRIPPNEESDARVAILYEGLIDLTTMSDVNRDFESSPIVSSLIEIFPYPMRRIS